MDRWEYRIIYGELDVKQLNEHGKTGWELVTVQDRGIYFFKRKLEVMKTRVRKRTND